MVGLQIVAKQEVSPMKRAFWAMALSFGLGVTGADAATMQAVYSGFVVGGYDQTGVFGAPNTDLDNMGFALTMIYNTQTEGSVPEQIRQTAEAAGVPVVEVTETVAPGADSFEAWQVAQLTSLAKALGVAV